MDLRGVGLPSLASVLIDSWSASDSVNDAWRARFWANFKVCSSMLFLVELAALVFLVVFFSIEIGPLGQSAIEKRRVKPWSVRV